MDIIELKIWYYCYIQDKYIFLYRLRVQDHKTFFWEGGGGGGVEEASYKKNKNVRKKT